MTEKNIDLEISHLADGGIQEKLDGELKKVFDNIYDLDTEPKTKRSITIKLEFIPDENREVISLASTFTTKLANTNGVLTTVLAGRNFDTGMIEARELKSSTKGQTYLDPDDGMALKTDVGEPVDGKVLDLQKKRG